MGCLKIVDRFRGGDELELCSQRFVEGTSRVEIAAPPFFQPSRRSHVRGWYTTSGS
jgi:hypothetical protein